MPMETTKDLSTGCCGVEPASCDCKPTAALQPMFPAAQGENVCCGPPTDPPSSPFERPGYRIQPFVEDFVDTGAGPVPRVKTALSSADRLGSFRVRWGIRRNQYKISPGLYCIGRPDGDSPVLVTANYKLTFDALRSEAGLPAAWILVVDTRGINVWCAAGKGTFSSEEVSHRVRVAGLDKIVNHRRLILPQLAATGVSARRVKKQCGFKVVWGPVRIADVKQFLDAGLQASTDMRRVTFTLRERLVLIPVELSALPRYILWVAAVVFLLSGVGSGVFSFQAAWSRGEWLAAALGGGIIAGAVLSPLLLPWIPARSFSLKGALVGIPVGGIVVWMLRGRVNGLEAAALVTCTAVLSSYLAMNFTGATPFTSPSGVEKEMRRALPAQAGALLLAAILWVSAAFA